MSPRNQGLQDPPLLLTAHACVSEGGGGELDPQGLDLELPELRCVWCPISHVIREGSLPASHGMCSIAEAIQRDEIDRRIRERQAGIVTGAAIAQAVYGVAGPMPLQAHLRPLAHSAVTHGR